MNRFIAKILGGINAVVWFLLGVVAPILALGTMSKGTADVPLYIAAVVGGMLAATMICGGIALLVRIADSLDAIKASLGKAGPVKAAVAGTGYAKCPSCGDLNAQGADVCRACGKAMAA